MQGFCLGQAISGAIKGVIVAAIAAVLGYLLLGIGGGFIWFLVLGIMVSCIAILGNVVQLVGGLVAGGLLFLIASWANIPSEEFETLLSTNLAVALDDPQKAAGTIITAAIFIIGLFIMVILLYFILPGPEDENAMIIISLGIGVVAGLILFFIHGSHPDPQLVRSTTIFGGIVGFISGLLPGHPFL